MLLLGLSRHDAARLHLSSRSRLDWTEPAFHVRRDPDRTQFYGVRPERDRGAEPQTPEAADNPWDASTLEWATSSPPPPYNFARIPVVSGLTPLWESRDGLPFVTGLRVDRKEIVVTTGIDAEPDFREPVPENSIWPLIAAAFTTVMLIGSIFTRSAVVWGAIPVGVALVGWFYPRRVSAPLPGEVS